MYDERDIQRMIDSCRADGDGMPRAADLAQLELAALAERLLHDPATRQQWVRAHRVDSKIAAALADIPVPSGLAERILQRLAADGTEAVGVATTSEHDSPVAGTIVPRRRFAERLWSRRRMVVGVLATAAAALLAFTVFWPSEPISPARLLDEVSEFDASFVPGPGSLVAAVPPSATYAMSSRILAAPGTTWTGFSGLLGRKGVAYSLTSPGGVKATLYVVRAKGLPNDPQIAMSQIPTAPPGSPRSASGGKTMAAWQEQGRLYVLVVHGDERAYQRFVRPAPPIA